MKSFFKEFLRDDPPVAGAAPQICLGIFGKHPGWNDHMDDIGLDTESLLATKHLLYLQGIGGQLNSGAWEKLTEEARLPAIHHEFIWAREAQILAGRMWPSSDGKRRTLYPMVACAHGFGVRAETMIAQILPQLATVETGCRATVSPIAVQAVIAAVRATCGAACVPGERSGLGRLSFALPEDWIKGRLAGILREVRALMVNYLRDGFRERAEPRAVGVRVPALASSAKEDLVFWSRFFGAVIDPKAPLLIIKSLGRDWVDVIAGEPATEEIFCLRAAPPALPILGESAGAEEGERQAALNLSQAIMDPDSAAAEQSRSGERTWLQKIFG